MMVRISTPIGRDRFGLARLLSRLLARPAARRGPRIADLGELSPHLLRDIGLGEEPGGRRRSCLWGDR